MSIATRISSMEEHIKESYQELKGIGLDITGFNKNLENIPRVIDNYWETLPKVSGNGTDITLDNTKEGKMKIELKGDTSQFTTTGKQLFDVNGTLYSGSIDKVGNGFRLTNDGTYRNLSITLPNQLPAGTYKITYVMKNSTVADLTKAAFSLRDNSSQLAIARPDISGEVTLTIESPATRMYAYIGASEASGATVTYDDFMISITGGDFEPYTGGIPSPNPTYSQNIEVVTGEQNIKISNKNLYTGAIQIAIGSSASSPTGYRVLTTNLNYRGFALKVTPNEIYSISRLTLSSSRLRYGFTKVYPVHETPLYSFHENDNSLKIENIVVPSEMNYFVIYLSNTKEEPNDLQIEKNASATTYLAHQEQNYPINLGTIELCKIGDYQDRIYRTSGKNLFNKDTTYVKNISIQTNTNAISSSNNAKTSYIECQPNTKYTISKAQVSARFIIATSKVVPASGINLLQTLTASSSTSATITTDAEAKYLLVYYYLATSDTLTEEQIRNTIQIEYGDTATTYEPYGYGDWYKHKAISKYVFDGTENWITGQYGTNSWQIANLISTNYDTTKAQILSTIFRGISQDDRNTGGNNTIYTISNASFYVRNTNITTKANMQAATNGTPIYYPLATPVEEAITEPTLVTQLNNLYYASSYEEQTNINSRGILATDMSANALEDSSN